MKMLKKLAFALLALMILSSLPWILLYSNALWNKPNLPLDPPRFPTLTATMEIRGKAYPMEFTWTEENYQQWNAGQGWNTRWKSSHHTLTRILDEQYAIVVWLPHAYEKKLDQFIPEIALIERKNLQFLRLYRDFKLNENRDGVFCFKHLTLERKPNAKIAKPMTKEEEALKKEITQRRFGYLYAWAFEQEHWSRSEQLQKLFSPLKEVTPLGKWEDGGKEGTEVWRAVARFRGDNHEIEKSRTMFGFEYQKQSEAWTPLPYENVFVFGEGLDNKSAPALVSYHEKRFDSRKHELLYDATKQQLVILYRLGLNSLDNLVP